MRCCYSFYFSVKKIDLGNKRHELIKTEERFETPTVSLLEIVFKYLYPIKKKLIKKISKINQSQGMLQKYLDISYLSCENQVSIVTLIP